MASPASCQLGSKEQGELLSWVATKVKTELDGTPELSDLYYGVEAASELSSSGVGSLPGSAICAAIKAARPAALPDLFFATSLTQTLRCSDSKALLSAAEAAAVAALEGAGTVEDAYYAVSTLVALKAKAPKSLDRLPKLFANLTHSSGALRRQADGLSRPSFTATGLAYLTAAAAKQLQRGFSAPDLINNVPQVFTLAKGDGGLWGKSDDDRLESTARVLQGAAVLGKAGVDAEKASKAGAYIAKLLPPGSLSDAYFSVVGLKAVSGHGSLPAAVVLAQVATAGQVKGSIEVSLRKAWGDDIPSCTLTGTAAVAGDKAESVALSFTGSDASYTASFDAPALGEYSVTVEAFDCADAPGPRASASFPAYVLGACQLTDAAVALGNAGGNSVQRPTYPAPLPAPLEVDHESQAKVSFKVTAGGGALLPQQAQLVASSKARGVSAYFAAKAKGDSLAATLTAAGVEKQLGTLGGEFELTLLVADPGCAEPLAWPLGVLQLSHSPLEDGSQPPEPESPLAALYAPKPTILHMHRAPEKRPPAFVSLAFTAAALAPLGVAAALVAAAGGNIKGFPASSLPTLLFQCGLAAILLLYTLFWTSLNLLQTLPLLAALGVFTAVSGHFALSAHADARLKQE